MNLRGAIIEAYISSSGGTHVAATAEEISSYVRAYRHYLHGWLSADPKLRWLDLGCGQGHLMQLARELGYSQIEGVDASAEMIRLASQAGLKVRLGDVFEALQALPARSCDIISCFDLLEHFPKEKGFELLREINRVLTPNGTLLLKLPNAYSPWGYGITANDLTHETAYTVATVLQLGRLTGFKRGEAREVGPVPHSFSGFVRWIVWRVLRTLAQIWDVAETGHPRTALYTRVMVVRLMRNTN